MLRLTETQYRSLLLFEMMMLIVDGDGDHSVIRLLMLGGAGSINDTSGIILNLKGRRRAQVYGCSRHFFTSIFLERRGGYD